MKEGPTALLGKEIGHIRVVDLLAEGGMGTVYAGFDTTLQRRVALKAIRSQFELDAAAKDRFRREARLLSQLDHPSICRVYDFIENENGDFLVLELVEGNNMREVLARGLTWSEKLAIARELLDVLVAVHRRNLIHRDLKPDNVMITTTGKVKVLDFGLATLLIDEARLSAATTIVPEGGTVADESGEVARPHVSPPSGGAITGLGVIAGTAGYMSPEQARGERTTATSDMYSLGVMLQEMFSGTPPFPPDLPRSEVIAKTAAGEHPPVTGLPPDLAALIERLEAFAPGARPSSVDAAEQLQRIIDRPRRRRRRIVIAALWLALAGLAAGTTVQSLRASRAARQAATEAEAARRASDFLVDLFAVSDPGEARGNTVTAREVLDRGAEAIERGLAQEPLLQARLMNTIGAVYTKLGLYSKASPLLEGACEIREEQLGSEHPDLAVSLGALGALRWRQGRYDEAEKLFLRAIEISERRAVRNDPVLAGYQHNLAVLYEEQGRYDEAKALFETALKAREAALGRDHVKVADTLNSLGILSEHQGHLKVAEQLLRRALRIRSQWFAGDHPQVAESLNNVGTVLVDQGHYEEAEQFHRRALAMRKKLFGPDHPLVASSLNNLAIISDVLGRQDEAESLYEQALKITRAALGTEHERVAMVLNNLGCVYTAQKRFGKAEKVLREAHGIWLRAFGPDHPYVAEADHNLANVYRDQDRFAEAEPLYQEALRVREKTLGPSHPEVARCLADLARLYLREGRQAEARPLLQRALEIQESALDPNHPDLASTRATYDQLLRAGGKGSP